MDVDAQRVGEGSAGGQPDTQPGERSGTLPHHNCVEVCPGDACLFEAFQDAGGEDLRVAPRGGLHTF